MAGFSLMGVFGVEIDLVLFIGETLSDFLKERGVDENRVQFLREIIDLFPGVGFEVVLDGLLELLEIPSLLQLIRAFPENNQAHFVVGNHSLDQELAENHVLQLEITDFHEDQQEPGNQEEVQVDLQVLHDNVHLLETLSHDVLEDLDVGNQGNHVDVVVLGEDVFKAVGHDPKDLFLAELQFHQVIADEIHTLTVAQVHVSLRESNQNPSHFLHFFETKFFALLFTPRDVQIDDSEVVLEVTHVEERQLKALEVVFVDVLIGDRVCEQEPDFLPFRKRNSHDVVLQVSSGGSSSRNVERTLPGNNSIEDLPLSGDVEDLLELFVLPVLLFEAFLFFELVVPKVVVLTLGFGKRRLNQALYRLDFRGIGLLVELLDAHILMEI